MVSSDEKPASESVNKESSTKSDSSSQSSPDSIADIIRDAVSVEYRSNAEWVSADIDSTEGENFIKSLIALFPKQFGEVAAAYMPEDIVIKIILEKATQYNVDTSSSASETREVEISTIEIATNGVVFLMPQGLSLAAVKDVETILSSEEKSQIENVPPIVESENPPAGDTSSQSSIPHNVPNPVLVTIKADKEIYFLQDESIKITISNDDAFLYTYGPEYDIEKFENEQWISTSWFDNYNWISALEQLPPHSQCEYVFKIQDNRFPFTPGEYRFITKGAAETDEGRLLEYAPNLIVTFTIQ